MSLIKFPARLLFVLTTSFKETYQIHENFLVQANKSVITCMAWHEIFNLWVPVFSKVTQDDQRF